MIIGIARRGDQSSLWPLRTVVFSCCFSADIHTAPPQGEVSITQGYDQQAL
jgi:hypothetical protein